MSTSGSSGFRPLDSGVARATGSDREERIREDFHRHNLRAEARRSRRGLIRRLFRRR